MSRLILITGPNGAGKGTLLEALIKEKGSGRVRTTMNRPYRSDAERKERVRLRTLHFKRDLRRPAHEKRFYEMEEVRSKAWYGLRGCDLAEAMDSRSLNYLDVDIRGTQKALTGKNLNPDAFITAAKHRKKPDSWVREMLNSIQKPLVILVTAKPDVLRTRLIDRTLALGKSVDYSDLQDRMEKAQEDIASIQTLQELGKKHLFVIDNSKMNPERVVQAALDFIRKTKA